MIPSQNSPAKRIAFGGVLVALSLIFSYVEMLIPLNFGVPGIKLGLANLVVLSGLYLFRPHEVLLISVSRILLAGFLFGNGMSIVYSLAGGLLSFAVMMLLKRFDFSKTGVSIGGGVSHNIGQILVAALVLRSARLLYYLPVLMIAGLVSGFLIGIITDRVLRLLKT